MRYGMILPGGSAAEQIHQATIAEESGWDGVFTWETAYGLDPWSLLTAMAMGTERVRLGTMLTPLPWRRPWKLASQVATLDQISGGRAIVTVGLGALSDDLPRTGEEAGLRERADRLDEGIDMMKTLWGGGSAYHGRCYDYEGASPDFLSAACQPVQQAIPIWVVAAAGRPKSMQRVLRCSGVVPQYPPDPNDAERQPGPADARVVAEWLRANDAGHLDLISEGQTPASDAAAAADQVAPWEDAGATWWLENRWGWASDLDERIAQTTERLEAGPPRRR